MPMDARVFRDLEALSRGALEELLRALREAIEQRGRFAIALSGGRTPAKLYALWAESGKNGPHTPWDRVHLFWGVERYVPHDDLLSNYRMARETLIAHVPIPPANVHPMPTGYAHPEDAAEAYESELRAFFGSESPAFDVQLLGLGADGHTASLFPGCPLLHGTHRWVAAVEAPAQPTQRLTLTPTVLNQGRNTFFLVSGSDKRAIIAGLKIEDPTKPSRYPAGQVRPTGRVLLFLDDAAAGGPHA